MLKNCAHCDNSFEDFGDDKEYCSVTCQGLAMNDSEMNEEFNFSASNAKSIDPRGGQ